jgi:hypothetical protein
MVRRLFRGSIRTQLAVNWRVLVVAFVGFVLLSYIGIWIDCWNEKEHGHEYSSYQWRGLSAIAAPGIFLASRFSEQSLSHADQETWTWIAHVASLLNGLLYAGGVALLGRLIANCLDETCGPAKDRESQEP